ncbi:MAG: YggS family pyridoxal phosphate-dependent enzyme [Betaproteobacteria bacterium]
MSIAENITKVRQTMDRAAAEHGRDPTSVRLLAVSKTFAAEAVIQAADSGQIAFGENYLQEAIDKQQAVHSLRPDLSLEWHFIGPIQSNKTRPIAEHFAWVHALDREKIARRLSEQRPQDLPPLNVCLQVNVSGEDSKSGVAPAGVLALAQVVATLPGLSLRGLMAIPEPANDFDSQRKPFALLRALQQQLTEAGIPTDTLSMGMSADMHAAIAEGATIVRIGTAIFGKRDYAN